MPLARRTGSKRPGGGVIADALRAPLRRGVSPNTVWEGTEAMTCYLTIGLALIVAFATSVQAQTFIYVDVNADLEPHDGSAWCHAYLTLDEALNLVAPDTVIRVANGTYVPDATGLVDPLAARFYLVNTVRIEGGYAGCGAVDPDVRDIALYETILSGDLAGDDQPVGCMQDSPDCASFGERCIDGFCIIHANYAENAYTVVSSGSVDETAVLDGFTITGGNNIAGTLPPNHSGGGMLIDSQSSSTIANCTIAGNRAVSGGGGLLIAGAAHPTLTNCTIAGNWANDSGGGIMNIQASPSLTDCTISGNWATRGGGMRTVGDNASPTLTGCTISGNTAGVSGGGLYNSNGGNPTLNDCTISGNRAAYSGGWPYGNGGGLYNGYGGNLTLNDCTISGNMATRNGGGMFNDCTFATDTRATLTRCTIHDNTAGGGGGGVSNETPISAISAGTGAFIFTDCVFSANTAAADGGGMYSHIGEFGGSISVTLANCTFSGNTADGFGGGMYSSNCYQCSGTISSVLTNCTFTGNSVSYSWGGGVGLWGSGVNATLTNCTFSGNRAPIFNGGQSLYVVRDAVARVSNCIFWGHWALFGDVDATYSNIQSGWWPGQGNFSTDPLFVDADGADDIAGTDDDDLRLSAGSPCIDAGDNDADTDARTPEVDPLPSSDRDGRPRFVDDPDTVDTGNPGAMDLPVVDVGAYEYGDDCNGNGIVDSQDIADCSGDPACDDCNGNGAPDECDIPRWFDDCDGNGVPNECETLEPEPGDHDADGDIDLLDYSALQRCFTGVGPAVVPPCCAVFDFEPPDDDIDLDDYAAFYAIFAPRMSR